MNDTYKNNLNTDRPESLHSSSSNENKGKILRFRKSERLMHWAVAIPFLICFATAFVLVVVYNPDPERPYRRLFSVIHRCSGISLAILPLLAGIKCAGDFKVYFNNIMQAWRWTFSDMKWLMVLALAKINPKIEPPKQGKFNAAEKMNFMYLQGTYPIYFITGTIMWLEIIGVRHWIADFAFIAWIIHFAAAVFATPLIMGHIFMAVVNPETRVGLQGMISGFVDREWAKHHYNIWYHENFVDDNDKKKKSKKETKVTDLKILRKHADLISPEKKKRFDELLRKHDRKNDTLADMGKLHFFLGQIYEEEGKEELAIKQYTVMVNDFEKTMGKSVEMEMAVQRLAKLKKEV